MRFVYWMNPLFFMVLWAGVAVFAFTAPEETYLVLMRSAKLYTLDHLVITLIALAIFSLFTILGMSSVLRRPKRAADVRQKLERLFAEPVILQICLAFFGLVVIAYAVWFGPTLNASTLIDFLNGNVRAREVGNQVSGVTTMTQFGIALACVSTYGAIFCPVSGMRRLYRIMLFSLIVFAFYRSLLWSERLALLEILVPMTIILVFCYNRGQKLFFLLPVIGVVAFVTYFGLAEYFRSWNFYKTQDIGMVYFAVTRFLSYYVSSFNNFGMMLEHIPPSYEPLNSARFLYKAPVPGFEDLNARADAIWVQYTDALSAYANPEFNLFTAVGMVVSDFGVAGGIMVLTIHGFLTGRFFALMSEGRIFGLLFYPVWIVGLMEFGRLLYWGNTRVLPAWLLLCLIALVAKSLHFKRTQPNSVAA